MCCAGVRCAAGCMHEGMKESNAWQALALAQRPCMKHAALTLCTTSLTAGGWGAGQESASPEPEGPPTLGRSRYKGSPSLRVLPPLQISPPEPGRGPVILHAAPHLAGTVRCTHQSWTQMCRAPVTVCNAWQCCMRSTILMLCARAYSGGLDLIITPWYDGVQVLQILASLKGE